MKFIQSIEAVALVVALSSLSACGTIAEKTQGDDVLREKAAFALNTDAESVQVLSKSSSLDSVKFQVKSDKGIYNCYFTSVVIVNSDALCSGPLSKSSQKPAVQKSEKTESCNALLKAANRC